MTPNVSGTYVLSGYTYGQPVYTSTTQSQFSIQWVGQWGIWNSLGPVIEFDGGANLLGNYSITGADQTGTAVVAISSGPYGQPMIWMGAFNDAVAYPVAAVLTYDGHLYISNTALAAGSWNSANWTQIV